MLLQYRELPESRVIDLIPDTRVLAVAAEQFEEDVEGGEDDKECDGNSD